jgi:hypothetical protein
LSHKLYICPSSNKTTYLNAQDLLHPYG